jgi:integrase
MATPRKTAQGTWRIIIEARGQRDSKTLPTRREAVEWGQRRVLELRHQADTPEGQRKTLLDALRRYAEEVTPPKRGNAKEAIRLQAFERQALPLAKPMASITPADLAAWRDARLAVNARGAVLRDMSLLSSVLETARREWGWLQSNPLADVRRPAQPDHRERVIAWGEIRGVLRALGHDARHRKVRTISHAVGVCFLVALRTGMRAGELCGLAWADVAADQCRLHMTKTGKARTVPLTPKARATMARMVGFDAVLVFGLKSQSLDTLFRKARARAGLDGFTFHDSRHTAATMLAKKLHVLELCKVFGWARTDQALTYFNPQAGELAKRMA